MTPANIIVIQRNGIMMKLVITNLNKYRNRKMYKWFHTNSQKPSQLMSWLFLKNHVNVNV